MKYTVDVICNGVWFKHSKEIKDNDEDKTVKENFERQNLVNNSQELVEEKKGGAE